MTIRKLSLEEWFTNYQLAAVRRRHFHLPMELTIDLSKTVTAWRSKNSGEPPFTAFVTKAIAMLAEEMPHVNRAVFQTFYGPRLIQFEKVIINMPVIVPADGRDHLSAVLLHEPQKKSLDEIRREISAARKRDINKMPFGRFIVRSGNYCWNRAILRLLHFVIFNFPAVYERFGGGGVAFSSLLNHRAPNFQAMIHAGFHTGYTFCSASVTENEGKTMLLLGVMWDHYASQGNEMAGALKRLTAILSGEDEKALFELLR